MIVLLPVLWLCLNLILSLPLLAILYQHISTKVIIRITLVDLVNLDLLLYLYTFGLVLSVALIQCLVALENNAVLSEWASEIYTCLLEVLIWCLTTSLILSEALRLITLYKGSEAYGLQLLGPDDIAIVRVRLVSITFAILFEALVALYLKLHTGFYTLFSSSSTISVANEVSRNVSKAIFLVLPGIALLFNLTIKVYSHLLNKTLKASQTIFTISAGEQDSNRDVFLMSLKAVFALTLNVAYIILTSHADRTARLVFFFPLNMSLLLVLAPLAIIIRNKQMKAHLFNQLKNLISYWMRQLPRRENSIAPVE